MISFAFFLIKYGGILETSSWFFNKKFVFFSRFFFNVLRTCLSQSYILKNKICLKNLRAKNGGYLRNTSNDILTENCGTLEIILARTLDKKWWIFAKFFNNFWKENNWFKITCDQKIILINQMFSKTFWSKTAYFFEKIISRTFTPKVVNFLRTLFKN